MSTRLFIMFFVILPQLFINQLENEETIFCCHRFLSTVFSGKL